MKARMRFWDGKWWCRRLGITGCGDTMEAAWDDMWNLYSETFRSHPVDFRPAPRA